MILSDPGGFTDIQSILVGLANKITTPFFLILFVLCAFSAITSTFGACLHSLVSLIIVNIIEPFKINKNDQQKIRMAIILSICIGGLIYLATILNSSTIVELLFYSGNIYSALLAPIIAIVYSKGRVSNIIPFSAVIGMIVSFLMLPFVSGFQSIWISGIVSFMIVVIYMAGIRLIGRRRVQG